MPHQIALTILADVKPGEADKLKHLLASLGESEQPTDALPFHRLEMVHFARLFVLDEADDPAGGRIPAKLVFMTDLDAPLYRYLGRLLDLAGDTLDRIYSHCEDYPDAERVSRRGRLAYLRNRMLRSDVAYINTIGRSARQIRQEARLRERIEEFLDRHERDWADRDPAEIRAAVQAFVRAEQELRWALKPARPPLLPWRVKEKLHLVGGVLLLLALSPLILLAAPFWLIALRWHEDADPEPDVKLDQARLEELAKPEDRWPQNQLSAIGRVKPGRFRRLTIDGILRLINFTVRHYFNRGSLAGITTIHFARWIFIDSERLVFASSYDGSLESYMDDFIDKVGWGLNAVFSAGINYPKTYFLLWGGASDEQGFKKFLRSNQVVTQYWYSAYRDLTAINVANNAAIRAGLSGSMSDEEVQRWLRRL